MYHYIEDKDFLKNMRILCSDIVNQLKVSINNDEPELNANVYLVGSGAKNLITQNGYEAVDLDYNLEIRDEYGRLFAHDVKQYIQYQFNNILKRNNWDDCHDSTSALTTEQRCFEYGNQTCFSIDLCIVRRTRYGFERLIHHKTGFTSLDTWLWNQISQYDIDDKVRELKNSGLWNDVRERYLKKKNMYLRRHDYNHPSFIVYIETINEIYDEFC